MLDPIALAQSLIRCPSVTPEDGGALGVLEAALAPVGFECTRLRFEAPGTAPIDNIFARLGKGTPHFCFAGHSDVVPPGDIALWRADPFAAEIRDGVLYGRGAADMKSAIAAFAAAATQHSKALSRGSISLLITGDEEGPAINGTAKVLEWLARKGERIDHCVVGEPTARAHAGDTIKIGRRGSLRAEIAVRGVQGHTAYPQNALNPIPVLAAIVSRLAGEPLDTGTAHFEPSTLVFTTFNVGNAASNVSPAVARAAASIRFNDLRTPQMLASHIEERAAEVTRAMGGEASVAIDVGALPFLTEPGGFIDLLSRAIHSATGSAPLLSTTGGTSDARFIKNYCPVAEVGLTGATMHKTDECVPVVEIGNLTKIYASILDAYFAAPPGS